MTLHNLHTSFAAHKGNYKHLWSIIYIFLTAINAWTCCYNVLAVSCFF